MVAKSLVEAFNAADDANAPLKATALATTVLVVKHILTVAVQVRDWGRNGWLLTSIDRLAG